MKSLRALGPYFRRYPKKLVGGIAANISGVLVGLASPILVGRAVDSFRTEVSTRSLLFYAGAILLVTLVQGVFSFTQRMVLVGLSRDIEFDLRNDYFRSLESQPPSFFQRRYTGDLMARGTNDLGAVRMLCGPAIMYSANTIFTSLGALAFMLSIHPKLTLVALAPMPIVAFVTKVFGQRIHVLFERVQEQFSSLSTKVQENLAGVRVIRAYAQEDAERAGFDAINAEYVERNRRLIRWNAAFHPLLQILIGFGFVAVLWYGGNLVREGAVTVGQFVTFTFFLGKLIWPMIAIGWVINLAQRGSASMRRILNVIESEPEIRDTPDAVAGIPEEGAIDFRGLTFAYPEVSGESELQEDARPGRPVLTDIDLSVEPGQTIAVIGRTGAGKSTLLATVPRLVDPPPGTVEVDGRDVRSRRLQDLRRAIAMVPQETFLFSATVADNIGFGDPEADRERIAEAARLAGLEDDLAGFPRGLDTLVGERGITLSGGQKQRVALARAILRDPRILLLDDCLSAVDTATEEKILGNLREVFPGRTVFLVSHRVSTVRAADLIIVLDDGRIAERGTHDELVARGGIYADLERRQRLEDELAAV